MSPFSYHFFYFFFISFYQNYLILLFSLSAYGAYEIRKNPLNSYDLIVICFWLLFWIGEIVADHQQWVFQNRKKHLLSSRSLGGVLTGEYADGFVSSGLWAYSRHPNFFCEQAIWWTFWTFTVSGTSGQLNWLISGPILLTLLFLGSTNFTESITLSKYPRYALYQNHVSMLIPWFSSDWSKSKPE